MSTPAETEKLAEYFTSEDYTRDRLDPQPGDFYYLVLADLRKALEPLRTEEPLSILDYGCGSSPYRSLFPNARYIRADYTPTPGLDIIIEPGKPLPLEAGSIDLVLSTQVLEHVQNVPEYLGEIARVLKPSGRAILSTHGAYMDHGCPWDFQRWTPDGLKRDLGAVGLTTTSAFKLTTGLRAVMFLFEHTSLKRDVSRRDKFGFGWEWFRRAAERNKTGFHRWVDGLTRECRVVEGSAQEPDLYIGLLLTAQLDETRP